MSNYYQNLSLENIVEEIDGIVYTEEWRDVIGFEGKYMVSNFGRVKALSRLRKKRSKKGKYIPEKISKLTTGNNGYLNCNFRKEGKTINVRVHRIEAEVFLPNVENKRCINHKNLIRTDNFLPNIEWATHSENTYHAYRATDRKGYWCGKLGKDSSRGKPVIQYDKDGKFIGMFFSALEANRKTGISEDGIGGVCRGHTKTSGGFIWKFA